MTMREGVWSVNSRHNNITWTAGINENKRTRVEQETEGEAVFQQRSDYE